MYLLVDKTKRLQSIGKNLHARAIRYLVKEQHCSSITLGVSLPLVLLPYDSSLTGASKAVSFINNFGWNVNGGRKKHILVLNELDTWLVPKKIFRELMIVGIRFDICNDPERLMGLINKNSRASSTGGGAGAGASASASPSPSSSAGSSPGGDDIAVSDSPEKTSRLQAMAEEKEFIRTLYLEAIKHLNHDSGVKIIMALEPTNQKIIGSIILFTNRSPLAKFYPFMDEASEFSTRSLPTDSVTSSQGDELIGGIIAPVIDPSYSNLTEIFKYGLICSGITFLKSSSTDTKINQCLMVGVGDDKWGNLSGIKDIGFQEWKYYYDYYDKRGSEEFKI